MSDGDNEREWCVVNSEKSNNEMGGGEGAASVIRVGVWFHYYHHPGLKTRPPCGIETGTPRHGARGEGDWG